MQKRILNHRDTYKIPNYYSWHNVTTNWYPITSAIMISDPEGKTAIVSNDRAQGGSSLKEGNMELMQQRSLGANDQLG
jgi:hypothetical protein